MSVEPWILFDDKFSWHIYTYWIGINFVHQKTYTVGKQKAMTLKNTHIQLVNSPASLLYWQTSKRKAHTYSGQSASQECIMTEALALG